MPTFDTLWNAHVGRDYVCDETLFPNQCAMRMGEALRAGGVSLAGIKKTCVTYDKAKFASHALGHVRSAQELANLFYRKPADIGAKSFKIYKGTIQKNIDALKSKKGMIFIMNGWGTTDHIDLWKGNGVSGTLKGGVTSGEDTYLDKGASTWFWEFD